MFIVPLHETHFHWLELMLATKFRQTKLDWFSRPPRKLEILTRQWHKFYKAYLKLEIYVICDAKVAKCITKTQIFIQNATVEKIDPSRQEKTVIQSSWSRRRRRVHSPGFAGVHQTTKRFNNEPITNTHTSRFHSQMNSACLVVCARRAISASFCVVVLVLEMNEDSPTPPGTRRAKEGRRHLRQKNSASPSATSPGQRKNILARKRPISEHSHRRPWNSGTNRRGTPN